MIAKNSCVFLVKGVFFRYSARVEALVILLHQEAEMQKSGQQSPQNIEQLIKCGLEYQNAGKIEAAKNCYIKALNASPIEPDANHFLGVAYHQLGNNGQALEYLKNAVELKPDSSQVFNHYGCTLLALNRLSEAMQAFIKAIELNSSNPDALFNLGQLISTEDALKKSESDEEREKTAAYAVELLNKAVTLNPSQLEWKVKLAGALLQAGQKDAVKNVLDFILNQKADIPEVYFIRSRINRGIEAYNDLKKSLILQPNTKSCINNIGLWHLTAENRPDALVWSKRGMIAAPSDIEILWNYALGLLANGHLRDGWLAAKCRHFKPEMFIERFGLPPEWNGRSLKNGSLLVFHEQGIGDELRFASCFEDLSKKMGANSIVETDARLLPLFSRSFPNLNFTEKLERKPGPPPKVNYTAIVKKFNIAAHCPLGDLPLHFRPTINHFKHGNSYLIPDTKQQEVWRKTFKQLGSKLKIGICWQTALPSKHYDDYFFDIHELEPIFSLKNSAFINLQYTECEHELKSAEENFNIKIFRPSNIDMFNELDAVAALISELDIVIGPMTAVISMAGGVGTKCFGLNLHPDWTCLGTDIQPWTPSMTCRYRGHSASWKPVMESIASEIATIKV